MKTTFPALKNIQKALDEAGVGDKVKAVVPLNADVYVSPDDKPSSGAFRPDIKDLMTDMVKFLHDHGAPFVVNIYPFLSLYQSDDFPFEFAFFDGGRNIQDKGGVSYSNVFDANYDTLVNALKKAGVPNLRVIVGEAGWPTDGNKNANLKLARRFYDGLLKKLSKNDGTPVRPGKMEVYLFGLFDEDMKSIAPGNFERHWGIFTYDGKSKFPMDLTGQGHDRLLSPVPDVQYLPRQWCVFDDGAKDKACRGTSSTRAPAATARRSATAAPATGWTRRATSPTPSTCTSRCRTRTCAPATSTGSPRSPTRTPPRAGACSRSRSSAPAAGPRRGSDGRRRRRSWPWP